MTNWFTTLIGILILVAIVLIIRYILMHGSHTASGCTGNCGTCGMGCASKYSAEAKRFEEIMNGKKEDKADR